MYRLIDHNCITRWSFPNLAFHSQHAVRFSITPQTCGRPQQHLMLGTTGISYAALFEGVDREGLAGRQMTGVFYIRHIRNSTRLLPPPKPESRLLFGSCSIAASFTEVKQLQIRSLILTSLKNLSLKDGKAVFLTKFS